MDRREFLKVSGLGLFGLTMPLGEMQRIVTSLPQRRAVIFFVLDGWPLGDLKALFEYLKRVRGETSAFEKFCALSNLRCALQNTSSLSSIVTDSAPAFAAWATGSKTINGSLSSLPDGRPLKTIFELAKERGLAVGCVTTTRVTHATPAAWYSHNPNRDDEDNIAIDALNLEVDVLMGGGLRHFDPQGRKDGRNLLEEFAKKDYLIVKNKDELKASMNTKKKILGLFAKSHIPYYIDRINYEPYRITQPSLVDMTLAALVRLSQEREGFVLQIEAGRIDHANHANDAFSSLLETLEADLTLNVVMNYLKTNPQALLIITSDHGTSGYNINGTGPEYNQSTEAFLKYRYQKASFEFIKPLFKGKSPQEIKDIFEQYTGQSITNEEAYLIYDKYNNPPSVLSNNYLYEPEATMGRILAACQTDAKTEKTLVLRGNIGFTSTTHTAEDQLTLIYALSRSLKVPARIDNTDLFYIMCRWLGIYYENPKMTEEEAKRYIPIVTAEEWKKHLLLHIA